MSSISRRLRLVVREVEKHDNLFARLSPTTASNLQLLARTHTRTNPNELEDSWNLLDVEENNPESFLPLFISVGDNSIYASYNGGSCEHLSSSEQDIIELPRTMLSGISHKLPEFVSVHALTIVEYGARVCVEPATVEDWELLEIYGDFMEQGGLLNQVSVIYPNQNLIVRVGDGIDRVQVKVIEATGITWGTSKYESSIWPDLSFESDSSSCRINDRTIPPCVLLIQDTEVIVSPKTRPSKKIIPWSSPLRLIPSDIDWGASFAALSGVTKRDAFNVEPGCVLVHHDQWKHGSTWAQIKTENSKLNQKTSVVRVTTSPKIPRNDAVLFIGTRLDLCTSLFLDCVCLRPLISVREESLERITMEEISLKYDRIRLPTWNIPDIDLANPTFEISSKSSCYHQNGRFVLPIGAVIPIPTTLVNSEETHYSNHWSRITLKGRDDSDEGHFIHLHLKDILFLWKKRRQGACRRSSGTIIAVHPSNLIQRPREIAMSSGSKGIFLDRIKYSCSTFLTLSGMSGSGKTHNALLVSALISFHFHRPIIYLDCNKLQKANPKMSGILEEIDSLFARVHEVGHAIIVLDDLDKLTPNLSSSDGDHVSARTHPANPIAIDQSKLIADRLSHLFEAAEHGPCNHGNTISISLIATCSNADSINPSVREGFGAVLSHSNVPVLSPEDRVDLLTAMIRRHHLRNHIDFDRSNISQRTEEFLPRDLQKLSLRASRAFQTNLTSSSIQNSLVSELAGFIPVAQISATKGEANNNSLWSDIGGLFDVKDKLETTVRHPVLYRRIYERAQIQLPRGILLYGPSGCGKSYLVPALARECNYQLVTCRGPEILDKYIGGSEANVRDLFGRASQMAPSILFLDELEALAPRRGSDSTGVTDRVVNQLLTLLDGVEDVSSGTVFIIGATSRPDQIDPAIIRPGRLEQHLYVGPPESTSEWSDLLLKVAKNWNLKPDSLLALSSGEEIAMIVNDKPRFCPADVLAAFDTAHLNAVHRTLAGDIPVDDIEKIELEIEDLNFGFQQTRPSLSESEARRLHPLYNSFRGHDSDLAGTETGNLPLKTSLR